MDDNGMVHVYVLLPRGKRLCAEFVAELADKLVERYDCGPDMEINMRPELDDPGHQGLLHYPCGGQSGHYPETATNRLSQLLADHD